MADATIFDRLKQDHDTHRQLFDRMADAKGEPDRLETLFEQFRVEVTAHAAAEEETLYATMLARPDLREDAQHSVSEHKEIDDYLEKMGELEFNSDAWRSKFADMKKRYLHHIREEEEEMFPDAVQELTVALGATAGRALIGKAVTINRMRGAPIALDNGAQGWITVHPSFLLRVPDERRKAEERERFVSELHEIGKQVKALA